MDSKTVKNPLRGKTPDVGRKPPMHTPTTSVKNVNGPNAGQYGSGDNYRRSATHSKIPKPLGDSKR